MNEIHSILGQRKEYIKTPLITISKKNPLSISAAGSIRSRPIYLGPDQGGAKPPETLLRKIFKSVKHKLGKKGPYRQQKN